MRWKRLLWGFGAVLVLAVIVVGIWFLRVMSAASGGGGIGRVFQAFEDPRKLFPGKDRLVVLVLGKDYNRDRKGMPYTKNSRADTIMLMGLDLVNPHITAVSIPRDTKMTGPDGITGKINSIMSRGGPEMMMQTLSQHFGIPVDYYVVLKPDAVRSIVDKLGGVDVETLDEMNYDDSWGQLHIHLPKGKVHLDGAAAEGFVRFRKTEPGQRHHKGPNLEEGDLRRAARQQQMIHAMVRAGMRPSNIVNLPSVIQTGFRQVETNLTQPQIIAISNLFQRSGGGQITSGTLPGQDGMEGGVYYWVIDEARSMRMLAWLIRGDANAARSVPRVAIYNASKVTGAAKSIASMLYAEGYDAFSGGSKSPNLESSLITFRSAIYQQVAADLGVRLGIGKVEKEQSSPLDTWSPDINVVIGSDAATRFAPIQNGSRSTDARSSRRSGSRRSPAPDVSVEAEPQGDPSGE